MALTKAWLEDRRTKCVLALGNEALGQSKGGKDYIKAELACIDAHLERLTLRESKP